MAWTLPNSSTTPGAIGSGNPTIVCVRGYSRSVRPPYSYAWRKFQVNVFRSYGITHKQWRGYTLDYLIPLELAAHPRISGTSGRSRKPMRSARTKSKVHCSPQPVTGIR